MIDDDWYPPFYGTGSAGSLSGEPDKPRAKVLAVLWVPDPEQRHGWREVYIARHEPAKRPRQRPFGFAASQSPRRGRR